MNRVILGKMRVHWGILCAEGPWGTYWSLQRSIWKPLAWSTPLITMMVNIYGGLYHAHTLQNVLPCLIPWTLPNSPIELVWLRCPFHGCENWPPKRTTNLPGIISKYVAEPEPESQVIHLSLCSMSHSHLWFPGFRESLREQADWPVFQNHLVSSSGSTNFPHTHPAVRCPKLATYKAQHGDKGYPLWSAGAHDQETLSGTADWGNVAGPCSAFLL